MKLSLRGEKKRKGESVKVKKHNTLAGIELNTDSAEGKFISPQTE